VILRHGILMAVALVAQTAKTDTPDIRMGAATGCYRNRHEQQRMPP